MTIELCGYIFQVVENQYYVSQNLGVYFFLNGNKIIYVGRTERSMKERIAEHNSWDIAKATHFGYCEILNETERSRLETAVFNTYRPELNDKRPS